MDKGIVLVTELLQGGELFERCVDEDGIRLEMVD